MCHQRSISAELDHPLIALWNIKLFSSVPLPHALSVSINSDQLSCVYVVSVLAIFATMELQIAAVLASLLLRCGDIELNPGPLRNEGE